MSGGASTSACRTPLQAVAQTAAVLPPHRTPSPSPSSVASNLLSRAKAIVSAFVSSPHDGIIFSLAAPAILALAADPLLAMVDTAIVGHLGQNELVSGPLGGACVQHSCTCAPLPSIGARGFSADVRQNHKETHFHSKSTVMHTCMLEEHACCKSPGGHAGVMQACSV